MSDPTPSERRAGMRWMVLAALFFSLMSLFVKWAGRWFPAQEVVFARSVGVMAISGCMLRRSGISPRGSDRRRLLLRSSFGFVALMCFYYAIIHLPLADVTVIQYTNPVFTVLLAAWFLREGVGRKEVTVTAVSLAGVVLVARPTFLFGTSAAALDPVAVGVALLGAVMSAAAYVTVRRLGRTEDPMVIVFWFAAFSVVASLPALAMNPVMPVGWQWLVLAGVALFTHMGQISITHGLKLERAGRATSVGYLQIVFAALWGLLFFAEVPGPLSVLGALLIVGSTLRLAR
ncbi:MAG: DMT family transporter [bacterium]